MPTTRGPAVPAAAQHPSHSLTPTRLTPSSSTAASALLRPAAERPPTLGRTPPHPTPRSAFPLASATLESGRHQNPTSALCPALVVLLLHAGGWRHGEGLQGQAGVHLVVPPTSRPPPYSLHRTTRRRPSTRAPPPTLSARRLRVTDVVERTDLPSACGVRRSQRSHTAGSGAASRMELWGGRSGGGGARAPLVAAVWTGCIAVTDGGGGCWMVSAAGHLLPKGEGAGLARTQRVQTVAGRRGVSNLRGRGARGGPVCRAGQLESGASVVEYRGVGV